VTLTEELLDKYFAESLDRLWASYSADVGLNVRNAQEKGLANILRTVLVTPSKRLIRKETLDHAQIYPIVQKFLQRQGSEKLLGSLKQFTNRYKKDESLRNTVKDILLVEQQIDNAMAPRKRFEELIQKLYSGNKKVKFSDKSITVQDLSGNEIGLSTLSSGEKHLIRLFVESLIVDECTILIDEPEISLHVDWQADLIPFLQTLNSRAQYILATHSPEIMSTIPDKRIFAL